MTDFSPELDFSETADPVNGETEPILAELKARELEAAEVVDESTPEPQFREESPAKGRGDAGGLIEPAGPFDPDDLSHLSDRSVSVLIATRDRPELLRRALASVKAQDFDSDIEVILIFDQSEPDLSLETEGEGFRVEAISNVRTPGLAGARNSGIDKASHPWIAFCDDDDEWLENKLTEQFVALEDTPRARACTSGIFVRYEGKDNRQIPDPEKLTFEGFLDDRMSECHSSSWLIHKETMLDYVGLVDEDLPASQGEDYDLMLRTSRECVIAVAEKPLTRVYWHGASFFFERWQVVYDALQYLLDKYPEFEDHPGGYARILGQQAVAKAAMGDRKAAFSLISKIVRISPTEKRVPVAAAVALGIPADTMLKTAHKFGKGI